MTIGFQRYLSRTQFEDLLLHVGGRISLQDTNYRHCIPTAELLSICLRFRIALCSRFASISIADNTEKLFSLPLQRLFLHSNMTCM
ncbi:hypothetical protein CRENBAI_024231 [Crenichthys baileyi]|uniref:Uncharacterized protein n=1 Tax=Crenichthys baileyi TaxID=28760 RepID=A0AAV9RHR9_9TELE